MPITESSKKSEQFKTLSNYLRMRLETDPQFAERVKSNPKQTLIDLGFDKSVLRESGATADECTCYDTTCWSSECPATCVGPSVTWTPEL